MSLDTVTVQCPYCWEYIQIEVEPGPEPQNFIQDCSVCCRPIALEVSEGENGVEVNANRSD
jgi:hypothetical protein